MKKTFILLLAICASIVASAQPRSIGGRIGFGIEASYQHTVGKNFVEADLGFYGYNCLGIASTYDFLICQPDWTDKGQWGFYAGPGAQIATDFKAFAFGVGGQIGLEYIFENTPLQLSVDWRPMFGPVLYKDLAAFWTGGICGFSIGARYFF